MKRMKRGIAVLLAAAVMVPEFPVSAVFGVEQKPENHMADSPVRIRLKHTGHIQQRAGKEEGGRRGIQYGKHAGPCDRRGGL